MSGALQAVYQNLRSFTPPLPNIGAAYEGGYFAGQISTAGNGVADFNLVVGPVASAQSFLKWKTSNTSTSGTSSDIDGPTNSSNMNNASHPAGQFCEGLTIGGYSDWYMPAKNELEVCYFNLKPTTTSNNGTASGVNPNSIPARTSNYSSGTPAQTSAADFKDTGAEDFSPLYYWASTQGTYADAWSATFSDGNQSYYYTKSSTKSVRAIRRVAV